MLLCLLSLDEKGPKKLLRFFKKKLTGYCLIPDYNRYECCFLSVVSMVSFILLQGCLKQQILQAQAKI